MNYLLDTHAFIWLDGPFNKLSPAVQNAITDPNNTIYLSLVSLWEMQIKFQAGKLKLRSPLIDILSDQQKNNQIQLLPITLTHILELNNLPDNHRDPFDRLLIAQAKAEGISLITDDPQIAKYPITVFW